MKKTEPFVPPNNIAAERAVLGAMMIRAEAIAAASVIVEPSDFYNPNHAYTYAAILHLYNKGQSVDLVSVAEQMKRDGTLTDTFNASDLISLQASVPVSYHAERYAQIIKDHSKLRSLMLVFDENRKTAQELPSDVDAFIDHVESEIFTIGSTGQVKNAVTPEEVIPENLHRLEELFKSDGSITGLPTGIADLDSILSGLHPNALYVLGARPAMGKTALALNAATHVAIREQKPVLFFSVEMDRNELMQRMLCAEAGVDTKHMTDGNLDEDDWTKIIAVTNLVARAPIFIDDNPNLSITELRSRARRVKAQIPELSLVVVDYLQLMSGGKNSGNRQQEISEISRGLKVLAREIEAPVFALSQLSRELERRADRRPMLSDLRESGAIEQDADVVCFLYRDEIYNADTNAKGVAELIVSKHRNGPTGMCRLAFFGPYTRFGNIAKAAE